MAINLMKHRCHRKVSIRIRVKNEVFRSLDQMTWSNYMYYCCAQVLISKKRPSANCINNLILNGNH